MCNIVDERCRKTERQKYDVRVIRSMMVMCNDIAIAVVIAVVYRGGRRPGLPNAPLRMDHNNKRTALKYKKNINILTYDRSRKTIALFVRKELARCCTAISPKLLLLRFRLVSVLL